MFKSAIALFAGLAAVASAYTTPVGAPDGNPIALPGLNDIVPAGKPYTITWKATTPGTVTLLLLRGPSTNVVPIGAPIASGIENTGTFVWTPSTSLEPDTTHYGLQLIVDATGQYQYSTQFGISNPSYTGASSSASLSAYTSTVVPATSLSASVSLSTSILSSIKTVTAANSTLATVTKIVSSQYVASTGFPVSNSSIILPTKSMSVPSSLVATATESTSATASAPASTGAAGHLQAALGLVGAVAGMVMVL